MSIFRTFIPPYGNMQLGELILLFMFAAANVVFFIYHYKTLKTVDDFIPRIFGHVASLNVGILLLLPHKNSLWTLLFGVSFERILRLGRWCARAVFLFLTIHLLGFWIYWAKEDIVDGKTDNRPLSLNS
eukprot:TRINITY_DN15235_c0_g1_i1.p1 TRINITY_DN15235_c0_g1~~TRINITY_DN15235_c0_g1_i1.p1  ORF type:complete len:129 (-),score=7.76 TRINITY_DN15235_c0_g1_i1:324-710(-)